MEGFASKSRGDLVEWPTFAISDHHKPPNAAAGAKTITLNPAMLKRSDAELKAVLAHEPAHWKNADGLGKLFVWAAGLPLIVLYEIGSRLTGASSPPDEGAPAGPGADRKSVV